MPPTEDDRPGPRQTLAMRMAEQGRQRAERAERLARLAPARAAGRNAAAADPRPAPGPASGDRDAAAALEEFLRSLTRGLEGQGPEAPPPRAPSLPEAAAEVLRFQRPPAAAETAAEAAAPCDLGRLAGVGPGLVWALRRAGIRDLAALAALEPAALAARLGPIGRLVPAAAWIAAARGEARA